MALYEALYGRQCHSPVGWFASWEARLLATDLVRDTLEKVNLIQKQLCIAQSRQKSYVDRKVRDVAYMLGEKVILRVLLGKKGKLSPRYIGPLEGSHTYIGSDSGFPSQRSNVTPTYSSQPGDSTSSRVNRFLQLDPIVFTGTNPEEDPQDFIDEIHKTLRVMRSNETEVVELASYCLKELAYSWFESREEGSPPARWGEFADAFIYHFLHTDTKAAHAAEFENLRRGSPSVWDYHMRFAYLSNYAIYILPTMEARVRRFVQGLSTLVINEAATTALNSDMNYGKLVAFIQATETRKLRNKMEREGSNKARSTGNFGGYSSGGRSAFRGGSTGPSQPFAQSSASAPPSGPNQQQQWSRFRPNQSNMGSYKQGRHGGRFQQQRRPPCPRGRQNSEASPDVVTGILTVQFHDLFDLIDPSSTLSYVTPYVAMEFGIEPEQLHESFSVSTLVSESIFAALVYRDCVVILRGRDTVADLIELRMVDFDVIMGMD
ncbi:uncharacterized protein [Nicotiana tomentosiformis]|uniref:uncharacterized protein n=1 Tax=Nicotiana tomentosiformis TaxID=4098 RepID=UPI00388CB5D4